MGNYFNGSVPYTGGKESLTLRALRVACSAVNHHPRSYDGSWCFGFGYVCSRCRMYADPWTEATRAAARDAVNNNDADVASVVRRTNRR